MASLERKLESLLFVSSKPLSIRQLAKLTESEPDAVRAAVGRIRERLGSDDHGIVLTEAGDTVQLATHPETGKLLERYLQEEEFGELTKPALETLTIVAYRGPIAKADLDTLRGVNCALILRNLLVRGLVSAQGETKKSTTAYTVSHEFLRHLGVNRVEELPDFDSLAKDPTVDALLHPEAVVEPAASVEEPGSGGGAA